MIKKAICPNCGAEGTVGRYCEFCGTKIVELKKDTEYSTTIRKTVLDFNPHCSHPSCNSLISNIQIF